MIPLLVGNGCGGFCVGEGEGLEEEDVDGGGEEVSGVLAFLLPIVSSEACIFWNMDTLLSRVLSEHLYFLVICINILSYSFVELIKFLVSFIGSVLDS